MKINNNDNKDIKDTLIDGITKNPADESNYIELGKIYIAEQNFQDALGVYEALLKVNPINSQALINAGSLHFYFKNINKSIDYYSRAAEIESKSFSIYMNLWQCLCRAGRIPARNEKLYKSTGTRKKQPDFV